MADQYTIDDLLKQARFEGPVDVHLDFDRLCRQLKKIYVLMIDGTWRSLAEIEEATGEPQASISAQLRHLRKPHYGSHIVDKQRRGETGTWEYQLRRR